MKRALWLFSLMAIILLINSCVIFNGAAVWAAASQINKTSLSTENANFEKESGIELVLVKRGLWSMQDFSKNKAIKNYFLSLLNNDLTYSLNNSQNEFVKQTIQDDKINIITNNKFNNYSNYERAILLIVSTSTLALMTESNYNPNNVKNMFFKFITCYDTRELPNIVNAKWYKSKNIILTTDGIIID
ncbi:MAG: hypothetical protein FWB95_08745 [Treponema sp.]|nr:hypothetical protein [Treponema sp.]